MTVFAPDLGSVQLYDVGLATDYTVNEDVGSVVCGGAGWTDAYFIQVDVGNDDAQVVGSVNGRLILTGNDANNDGVQLGFWGHTAAAAYRRLPFLPTAGTTIRFGIKAKITEVATTDILFGLTDVELTPFVAISEGIYMQSIGAATVLSGVLENGGAATSTTLNTDTSTITANTYFEAGFVVHGVDRVDFYMDGVKTSTTTMTNLSTEPLAPVISFLNFGAGTAGRTMTIERLTCTQTTA
ncbi:MAG: hypothetical protein GY838_13645 [bacterium]|nr:hypothetical protein [bacterium]